MSLISIIKSSKFVDKIILIMVNPDEAFAKKAINSFNPSNS